MMKPELVEQLSDSEITELQIAIEATKKARAEKRKKEAIARIREIGAAEQLNVYFEGQKGSPPKRKVDATNGR